MKLSRKEVKGFFRKIPALRFEDQHLTSFAGLIVLQALFNRLQLGDRLRACCAHLGARTSYPPHRIVLLLVVHIMMGFRHLQDIRYYRDDPMVRRLLNLCRLPDVASVSRALRRFDATVVERLRQLLRDLVLSALQRAKCARVTADFDGSLQFTQGHIEGTAVGFSPKRKGARGYRPLFCTVAQTGQFLDMHHRPAHLHDSNGAVDFLRHCLTQIRQACGRAVIEARLDAAFFGEKIVSLLDELGVEFTLSVPVERLATLKSQIEQRRRWRRVDAEWSFFEVDWKPKRWSRTYRVLLLRQRVRVQTKEPLQLSLFEPADFRYQYRAIMTSKATQARAVIAFHHGRGTQEKIFGEAKQHAALGWLPSKRKVANQIFTLCSMLAHNLGRELHMLVEKPRHRTRHKRPACWSFPTLATLRLRLFQRGGRLTRPQGQLTLTMSPNPAVQQELERCLDALTQAA